MKKNALLIFAVKFMFSLSFLLLFFIQCSKLSFIQDDAYISMRYAKNLSNGNGLVFNLHEKTEGYTNFLWVILLSGVIKLGLNPEQFSTIVSPFFGGLIIILTYLLLKIIISMFYKHNIEKDSSRLYETLPFLIFPLFAFNAAYIYWSASGMEETLFIFLFLSSFYFFVKHLAENIFHIVFIFLAILTCLTRPEGFLLIFSLAAYKLFRLKRYARLMFNRRLLSELLILCLTLFSFLLFRYCYYGYLLPNTFYAKSGFTLFHLKRGFDYLLSFLSGNMLYGIVFIIPIATAIIKKEGVLLTAILYSLIFCLLIVLIGGDVLPLHRLFFPVLPLIYSSYVLSLILFSNYKYNNIIKYFSVIILTGAICYSSFHNEFGIALEKRSYETGLVAKMKIYAGWAGQKQSGLMRTPVVALSTIGAFAYYSDTDVIDLAGLTDQYTAHNPKETAGITDSLPVYWKERTYNAEYVIKRSPDYIIFPAGAKPSAFPECALFVQPEFINNYYTQLIYSDELREYLPVFSKRENPAPIKTPPQWDNSFVSNYISASNLFLNLTRTGNKNILPDIKKEIDKMLAKCPQRKSEALTLLGYANYHSKQFDAAEGLFKESLAGDSMNSPALLYLRNIALIRKDTSSAVKYLIRLKRISPDALPNFNY